jgi:hypothetical protein
MATASSGRPAESRSTAAARLFDAGVSPIRKAG